MSDHKDHNPQAAGIYRAIALRFYSRYVEARENAERHGGDLSGYGSQHDAREADERYKAAIDEAIGQRDAYHQSRSLADLARWINQLAIDELVEQQQRKKAENCKLRAVGSQDDDE